MFESHVILRIRVPDSKSSVMNYFRLSTYSPYFNRGADPRSVNKSNAVVRLTDDRSLQALYVAVVSRRKLSAYRDQERSGSVSPCNRDISSSYPRYLYLQDKTSDLEQ